MGAVEVTGGRVGLLSTREAAALTGLSLNAFRTWASRCRRAGNDLHAPREAWTDGRTPMWDGEAVKAAWEARPGRGRWRDQAGN